MAVAIAILGDRSKVQFVPLDAEQRFAAVESGAIDVLSRNTTWTATRDTSLGLNFAGEPGQIDEPFGGPFGNLATKFDFYGDAPVKITSVSTPNGWTPFSCLLVAAD